MEFINLKKQFKIIENKINSNISKVLNHGKYIMGPEINELESKLAEYVNVKHAKFKGTALINLLYHVLKSNALFVQL